MHARLRPRAHRFAYRLFFLALDLDELPALSSRLSLLRIDRAGLFSFRQSDYLPTQDPLHNPSAAQAAAARLSTSSPASASPLKARLLAHLAARGVSTPADARVTLLTLPRVLGYLFNPVSFYFVSDAAGTPLAALAEVTNTFRETKLYVLGPDTLSQEPALGPTFRLRVPKHFYVSPFSDVDVAFDFRLRPPGERLALQIDDFENGQRSLVSTVTALAAPRALSDRALAWFSLKYPLVTLQVIAAIHWEALRLWVKRTPWFAKGARAADQRDLYHPHSSIVPSSPAAQPALPGPRSSLST